MTMTPYRRGRAPGTLTSKQVEARVQKIAGFLAGCNAGTVHAILEKCGALKTMRDGGVLEQQVSATEVNTSEKVDVPAIRRRLVESMTRQMEQGDANAARVLNAALEDMEYEAKADAFHIHIVPFDIPDRIFTQRTDDDNAVLMVRNPDGSTEPYVPCR